jgi:hypothetical protein
MSGAAGPPEARMTEHVSRSPTPHYQSGKPLQKGLAPLVVPSFQARRESSRSASLPSEVLANGQPIHRDCRI